MTTTTTTAQERVARIKAAYAAASGTWIGAAAAADAEAASTAAYAAVEAASSGRWRDAIQQAEAAQRYELRWLRCGDDPTWGSFTRTIIAAAADAAGDEVLAAIREALAAIREASDDHLAEE